MLQLKCSKYLHFSRIGMYIVQMFAISPICPHDMWKIFFANDVFFKPIFSITMCSIFQKIHLMPRVFDQKTVIFRPSPLHLPSPNHKPPRQQQLGPPRLDASALGSSQRPRGGLGAAHRLRGLPGRPGRGRSGSPEGGEEGLDGGLRG